VTSRRLIALLAVVPLLMAACGGQTSNKVEIRWYCCLGGGDGEDQVPVEEKVVADFNASHPNIKLVFEHQPYDAAFDIFSTEISSDNPPDIVGPLGIGGGNAFPNQWLDLSSLIASHNYDLTQFPSNTVDIYQFGDEGQIGIPFAFYPSVLFYKKSHFAEAGLNEPPHKAGEKYRWPDGREADWSYETAREVAMLLTVDENGNDATQAGFDPTKIVQWGFEPQRDDLRQTGADWGAGKLVADDGKTAQIPDAWAAAWHWFYDGIWTDHFAMTGPQFESPDYNPSDYPFFTGNVSMSANYLWSTYGVGDAGDDWDLAMLPSYNGQVTAAFNADTFRITKHTKHPEEAWTVLTYLLDEARAELLGTYVGMPARSAEQAAFFETLSANFTQTIDWQVAIDSVQFADVPNFESPMPDYNKAFDVIDEFGSKWQATEGLDLDQEIADLRDRLQAVFDQAQ
jgi:multiple sugar transport system substrate-binding protein